MEKDHHFFPFIFILKLFKLKALGSSVLRVGMSSMALIFSGSTSIAHSLTMCPSNFPEVTPKVHFLGFNLSLN